MKRTLSLVHGKGFPNSSRQLEKSLQRPKNSNDPNDYYSILGVPPWATKEEIKRVYKNLVKVFHPDGTDPDLDAFRLLQNIYEVLSNTELRRAYDSTPKGAMFIGEIEKEYIFTTKDLVDTFSLEDPPVVEYWSFYTNTKIEDLTIVNQWYSFLLDECYLRGLEVPLRLGFVQAGSEFESFSYESIEIDGDIVLLVNPSFIPEQYRATLLINSLKGLIENQQEILYNQYDITTSGLVKI